MNGKCILCFPETTFDIFVRIRSVTGDTAIEDVNLGVEMEMEIQFRNTRYTRNAFEMSNVILNILMQYSIFNMILL